MVAHRLGGRRRDVSAVSEQVDDFRNLEKRASCQGVLQLNDSRTAKVDVLEFKC